jgi:CBS domain-containing protein
MNISSLLATKGSHVVTVSYIESIAKAVSLLSENNIGALVVTDELEKVVGIISERDIVRLAARESQFQLTLVSDVMTRDVIVGVPEDDIMSVAHMMTEKRFRHIPVLDAGRLIGIISIGDILKAQRDQYQGQIDTMETQMLDGEDL